MIVSLVFVVGSEMDFFRKVSVMYIPIELEERRSKIIAKDEVDDHVRD